MQAVGQGDVDGVDRRILEDLLVGAGCPALPYGLDDGGGSIEPPQPRPVKPLQPQASASAEHACAGRMLLVIKPETERLVELADRSCGADRDERAAEVLHTTHQPRRLLPRWGRSQEASRGAARLLHIAELHEDRGVVQQHKRAASGAWIKLV